MLILAMKLLLYASVAYVLLVAAMYYMQTRMMFPAWRGMDLTPADAGWDYETVRLAVDGQETVGWFVPVENARGVALFSHGNAGNISGRLNSIALLRDFGLSVLAYDYGGYGLSMGEPSERRCYADAEACWRYLTEERGVPPEEIVLFGRSLGGAVTVDLAAKTEPAAVVLESTFYSAVDMARAMYPYLPVGLLLQHRFESGKKIAKVHAPKLFIHSREDDIVSYAQGRKLYNAAPPPKSFAHISGNHNSGFLDSDTEYRKAWREFLAQVLPEPKQAAG